MSVTCIECKFDNPQGFRYCGQCGARLLDTNLPADNPDANPTRYAERRQVTSLFCDIIDSTRIARQLDIEELRQVIRAYHNTCVPIIENYGGFISGYIGDGIQVMFGYPRAREDDAEQAVRAGLGIVDSMRYFKWTAESGQVITLSVRVGIGTGQVLAGDLVGKGMAKAEEIIGDNLNFAARLQSLADANTVLIGSPTKRLLGHQFKLFSLGQHMLKGFDQPIKVWRVDSFTEKQTRFESLRAADITPMVDRVNELKLLVDSWSESVHGKSRLVVISGEAGIGKSRLTQAFRDHVKSDSHYYLGFQCSPYHRNTALYPVISHLTHRLRIAPEQSLAEKTAKLERIFKLAGVGRDAALPVFCDLLSIALPHNSKFDSLTSTEKKLATFDAFVQQVKGLTRSRPVLIVIEDIHWSDPTSREFLDRFMRAIVDTAVLVVATHRSDSEQSAEFYPEATQLQLSRLDPIHSASLIKNVAGSRTISTHLIERIVRRADGVALFAEELTKTLLAPEGDSVDELEPAEFHNDHTIPETLHDSLMARLDQLTIGKRVAQICATIGRSFSLEMLQQISDFSSIHIQAGLNQLIDSDLVLHDLSEAEGAYRFKHALIRDAAYGSLLRAERRQLHRRIAETLEQAKQAIPAELLARHYSLAGLDEPAIDYWLQAGQNASEHSAQFEAGSHFRNGLKLLRMQAPSDSRQRKLLKFLISFGPILIAIRGSGAEETEENYREAISLTETVAASEDHFAALWGWWRISKNFKIKAQRAQKLQQLAERLDDNGLKLQAHHCQWATRFHLGDLDSAQEHVRKGKALYSDEHHSSHSSRYGGHDPRSCALGEIAQIHWLKGYSDKSRTMMQEARSWADYLQQTGSQAHVMDMNLLLLRYHGDARGAAAQGIELINFAQRNHFPELNAKAEVFLGWSMVKTGQAAQGIELMKQGIDSHTAIGTLEDPPVWLEMLAESYLDIGEYQAGLDATELAFQSTRQSGLQFWQAELHRRRGLLLHGLGELHHAEALENFRQAQRISHAQGALALELRATTSLALCSLPAEQAQAMDQLASLLTEFSAQHDGDDQRRGRELLTRFYSHSTPER